MTKGARVEGSGGEGRASATPRRPSLEEILAAMREQLGEAWPPRIYRERVLAMRTRSHALPPPSKSAGVEVLHTLLGIELKVGRRRISCPDLATARYLAVFALAGVGNVAAQTPPPKPLPNPVLVLSGTELFQTGGKSYIRYKYLVDNSSAYPDTMFAAAPNLPHCGGNAKSSRTWVDIYDQMGKRLYGFCAFSKPDDLNSIWFALEEGVVPPSYVYIELNDRATNTKYKSNLAETTP